MTIKEPRNPKLSFVRPMLFCIGYLFLFYITSQTVVLAYHGPGAGIWFPPSGLGFALLLILGVRYAPLVFFTLLIGGHELFNMPFGLSLVVLAFLNTLVYSLCAIILKKIDPDAGRFRRITGVTAFMMAALLAPVILASLTAYLMVQSQINSPYLLGLSMFQYWLSDSMTNVIAAPVILFFYYSGSNAALPSLPFLNPEKAPQPRLTFTRLIMILAEALCLLVILWIVFNQRRNFQQIYWYLLFPPMILIALTFGLRGSLLANLVTNLLTFVAIQWFGYSVGTLEEQQIFLLALGLTGLTCGAIFTEQAEGEKELRYRLSMEERITSISSRFISLKGAQVDDEIRKAMQTIGDLCGMDSGHLLFFSTEGKIEKAYEWVTPSSPTRQETLERFSLANLPWLLNQLKQGQVVQIVDVLELPQEAVAEIRHLVESGVRSMITLPLRQGQRLIGSLGFHSHKTIKKWKEEDVRLLTLLGEIFLEMFERQRAEDRIRENDLKFRSIVLQSYDGIILSDQDGYVVEWNRGMERITGMKRSQILGRYIWEVSYDMSVPEKKTQALLEQLHDISRETSSGARFSVNRLSEMEIQRADGARRLIQSQIFPIRSARGVMVGSINRDVTEIRQGEEELRASRASLSEAEKLAHLGHLRFSVPDGCMEWSDEAYRILECEMHDCAPTLSNFINKIHPDDQPMMYQAIDKVIQDQEAFAMEYRLVYSDGRVKTIDSIGRPLLNHRGEVTHIFSTVMDITERKQTEEAQHKSESRYRELADSISDVFFGLDANLCVTYWNRASEQMTAIPMDKAIGRSFYEVFPKLKGSNLEQFVIEAFRTGHQQGFVMEYRWHNRKRYLDVNAYPGQNGLSVFLRDITERHLVEERLRQSEARYRAVVEEQTDLILRFFPDGTVTFANGAYCRTFARSRRETVGSKYIRYKTLLDGKDLTGQHTLLRGGGRGWTYECQAILSDGKVHWFQWTDRPILDENGHIIEYQSVGRDVSESKRLEEELRYLSTHDALTGIYNRAFFEAELMRLQRSRTYPISILMVDVNGLKNINDSFGHPAGDELLKRAARVLSSCFRPEDVVARFGGDEFGVLLPNTDSPTAEEVVQRVRTSLNVYNRGSSGPELSLSVGIATGERGGSLLDVLSRADGLMYRDKGRQKEDKKKATGPLSEL